MQCTQSNKHTKMNLCTVKWAQFDIYFCRWACYDEQGL